MQKFTESLKMGKLVTSKCLSCKNLIWPPSNICPKCLVSKIEWIDVDTKGKLLEFSESFMAKSSIFGIVELHENIRLLGKIISDNPSELKKGMNVKLIRCGIENNEAYYEFQPM